MTEKLCRLADLAMCREIAAAFDVTTATVSNWPVRKPDFPAPVLTLAAGKVYDLRAVDRWWHLPANNTSRRRAAMEMTEAQMRRLPHRYPGVVGPGAGDAQTWPVGDLIGSREVCLSYGISRGLMHSWAHRRTQSGFPDPLLCFSSGPVFSRGAVQRWMAQWQRTPKALQVIVRAAAQRVTTGLS